MIGLPSLRALDRMQGTRIWLAVEAADMRCGFDRLAERVRAVIGQDPLGDSLFIFRSLFVFSCAAHNLIRLPRLWLNHRKRSGSSVSE